LTLSKQKIYGKSIINTTVPKPNQVVLLNKIMVLVILSLRNSANLSC